MDKKEILKILSEIKKGSATKEEKLAVMKELNLSLEEVNKRLAEVIDAIEMQKEEEKLKKSF